MTSLLDKAFSMARALPKDVQDDIARAILGLVEQQGDPEEIPHHHVAAVLDALKQADKRELATDDEVEALLRNFSS